jgi:hypothetical protein
VVLAAGSARDRQLRDDAPPAHVASIQQRRQIVAVVRSPSSRNTRYYPPAMDEWRMQLRQAREHLRLSRRRHLAAAGAAEAARVLTEPLAAAKRNPASDICGHL